MSSTVEYPAYEARITYTDSLAGEVVEYIAHDDQATFYAMVTGSVCGITTAEQVITDVRIIRTPFGGQ